MKRNLLFLVLLAVCFSSGCGRILGEGAGAVTGAKGAFVEYRDKPAPDLRGYKNVEFAQFTTVFGGTTPIILKMVPTETLTRLKEAELPGGAGGTLLIRGKVIYFEKAGVTGKIFGPLEECITEIELVDKASGRVLGVANCIGRGKTITTQGADKKAMGVAKGIVKWIKSHCKDKKD